MWGDDVRASDTHSPCSQDTRVNANAGESLMKPNEFATVNDIRAVLASQLNEAVMNLRFERNHLRRCLAARQEPDECDVVQLVRFWRKHEAR